MIGAAFDGVGPVAFALVQIGGRQQFGERDNAGQRRADVMRDAGERRLDRPRGSRKAAWPI